MLLKLLSAKRIPCEQGIDPMLFYRCTIVSDADPTLKQHWVNASSLLEYAFLYSRHQSNTKRFLHVDCMLVQRLREWLKIN